MRTAWMQAKAKEFGLQVINLESIDIPLSVVELIPVSVARENVCIALDVNDERLQVVAVDPRDLNLLERLRFILACEVELFLGKRSDILAAIDKYYGMFESDQESCILREFGGGEGLIFTDAELNQARIQAEASESSPTAKLVNLIVSEAISMKASDIHIEPFEDRVRIRYRIHGTLVERDTPPRRLLEPLTNQMKRLGQIDVKEKHRLQEGQIKSQLNGKNYNISISFLPTNYGQAIAMHFISEVCE